mgnify:CR=1 FL=1|tara:strand:+ start:534 stop:983 length:450 start_codon:yes stop_codon:yes gene_type:complete
MDKITIRGVMLTPLKIIKHPKGDILHVMKKGDEGFSNFGEVYFSTIKYNEIKGWNRHKKMTLNLTVPFGNVLFVLFDNRESSSTRGEYFEVSISLDNYFRLTVPPGIWMAMAGLGKEINYTLNVSSIKHDPNEKETVELSNINYNWNIY